MNNLPNLPMELINKILIMRPTHPNAIIIRSIHSTAKLIKRANKDVKDYVKSRFIFNPNCYSFYLFYFHYYYTNYLKRLKLLKNILNNRISI
jgi:hypothetical protein